MKNYLLFLLFLIFLSSYKTEKPFEENSNCYAKTGITNLPLIKNGLDGNNTWDELDCSIANLDTKDYLRLPDIQDVKVFIIGNFNSDDFFYTLVTIKQNKVVTKKDIGFAVDGYPEDSSRKVTEFEVNKDYTFKLIYKEREESGWNTLKIEKFKIDNNGLLVKI